MDIILDTSTSLFAKCDTGDSSHMTGKAEKREMCHLQIQ